VKSWKSCAVVLVIAFVATRLPAALVLAHDTDINLYARYAAEWHEAEQTGVSFYALHRQHIEREIQQAEPGSGKNRQEYKIVEYPPLAAAIMALPGYVVESCFETTSPTGYRPRYVVAYGCMMAVCDIASLLLVLVLAHRLDPSRSPGRASARGLVYLLCTLPMYAVLYSRLDLGVTLLTLAGLGLLLLLPWWPLSLGMLALAIHFKLMPVVLAPLWILATIPLSEGATWRSLLRAALGRTCVLATWGLAILGVFYHWQGGEILGFIGFHKDRGPEIESMPATVLVLLRYLGSDLGIYHSHGGFNVSSPYGPLVTAVATATMAALVLAASGLALHALRRVGSQNAAERRTLAEHSPQWVVEMTLALLLVALVFNKVFSAQYLVWILPFVALVDLGPRARPVCWLAGGLIAFLTMRIFPDCFVGEVIFAAGDGGASSLGGPTDYGAFLLLARNGLCLTLTGCLAWHLVANRPGRAASSLPKPASHLMPHLAPCLRTAQNSAVV
jgi:hypothetical protein